MKRRGRDGGAGRYLLRGIWVRPRLLRWNGEIGFVIICFILDI
jgi:hypothetical protein